VDVVHDLVLVAEQKEWDGEDGSSEETEKEVLVERSCTEHPLGTKGTPKDGSGEESVDTRAGESVLLGWRAHILDVCHLEIDDRDGHEGRNDSSNHLDPESNSGWNMRVMRKLKILRESNGMGSSHVAVTLEVVHGQSITREPQSSEKFGKHVEGNFLVGDRLDNTDRDTEDNGQGNTVYDDASIGVCRVSNHSADTKGN
jgi:hypothetical protein